MHTRPKSSHVNLRQILCLLAALLVGAGFLTACASSSMMATPVVQPAK